MLQKRKIHIVLTFTLLALSIGMKSWYTENIILTSFAKDITKYVAKQVADFDEVVLKYGAQLPTMLQEKNNREESVITAIKEMAAKPYTFFLAQHDSILFWNNNADLPHQKALATLHKTESESIVKTPAGMFFMKKQPLAGAQLFCLIPIKYEFGSNQLMRPHAFPASSFIPVGITVMPESGGAYQIISPSGKSVGQLIAVPNTEYKQPRNLQIFLFLAFALLYFTLAYRLAAEIKEKKGIQVASIFLISSLCLFFALKIGFGLTDTYSSGSLFAFSLDSFGSLGDLLLYLAVLLWLMIFFHKEHTMSRDKSHTHLVYQMVVAVVNYLSVMMSVIVSLFILRQLVQSTKVVFDFDNLFNLDNYNLLVIWGVIMMMGAMFLYSHKLMDSLKELSLSVYQRATAILIAGIAMALIYRLGFDFKIDTGFVIFFIMLYVAAFDAFVQSRKIEFYWVLGWIGLYSFYAAIALYEFNRSKDFDTRLTYAMQLAEPRDTLAECELPNLYNKLMVLGSSDAFKKSVGVIGPTNPPDSVIAHVNEQLGSDSYLNLYYKASVAIFDKRKATVLSDQLPYHIVVDSLYNKAQTVNGSDQIRHHGNSPLSFRYIMKFPTQRNSINGDPLDVYVSFVPKTSPNAMVYNDVFYDRQYRALSLLDRYDYVIFEKGVNVYQKGRINEKLYDPQYFPEKGSYRDYISNDKSRADLIYTDPSGDVSIVVGRPTGNFWKQVYLASSIFTVLCFFMFFLVIINTSLKFLPAYYNFYIESKGSLSKRIQYYTVILIMLALISVGGLTYHSFKDSSHKNEIVKNDYLSTTMLKNIKHTLESDTLKLTKGEQLKKLINMLPQLTVLFGRDVDIYNPSGHMVASSADYLQHKGLLQQCMDMSAFYALGKMRHSESLIEEKNAGIPFSRRYYALRNTDLDVIAFIGIPYYLPKYNINPANSDFVGKVLTVFVILLVAGAFVTVKITAGIIRPLESIIKQMQNHRIEEKHVPLIVDSYGDELVRLSNEYNNLIFKIKDFTKQLAEHERDKAFSEMAAMVAHEIKNAMSTIKLSLQTVLEARKTNDQATINKFLDRAINRNIKQVESLSHIAKDFGDFSMFNVPSRHPVNLNDTVKENFEYFEEDKTVKYTLKLPDEIIYTVGDSASFIRVIHNLMLNAKEAIPEDRPKLVHLELERKGTMGVITVTDNGVGIPQDVQENIFSPRFSTKSSGTGLGLSICSRIIQALGGRIYFETRLGEGTKFIVELPILENPDDYIYTKDDVFQNEFY